MVVKQAYDAAKQKFENSVYSVLRKFGRVNSGVGIGNQEPEPPYEREIPHDWLYRIRHSQSLVNNAIEEKVHQTFRRGFTEWEKEYIAKCPNCHETFESVEPFKDQLGQEAEEFDEADVDFSRARPCPDCERMVDFQTPDPDEKERAEMMFQQCNHQGHDDAYLDGNRQNSVGQSLEEVCKEVALDIQSFDDGWMVFERSYYTNHEGVVIDWELESIHRGAPELMRYSFSDSEQKLGHERWICVECRAKDENYRPQKKAGPCGQCGNRTYMAYAKRLKEPRGEAEEWFIRGEFVHGSEYHPSKFYGYPPIMTIWEEARTIEQMDRWYKESYEKRRAPRGALVVRSSNAKAVRSWNQEQMEAMGNDPQHIPTFMDDTDGKGEPLKWQPLLEEPAQMQHMQMREWFLDRISAKYGVTAIFQSANPAPSGLSQSMEIIVSNRSAQKLKEVFEDVFLPAILSQMQVDGWTRSIRRIEEEDEAAEAQRIGTELRNAKTATELGREVVWTDDDKANIKPGPFEQQEDEGGGMGGLFGSARNGKKEFPGHGQLEGVKRPGQAPWNDDEEEDDEEEDDEEEHEDVAGMTSTTGGRPYEPNQRSGEPRNPREPSTDDPIAYSANGSSANGSSSNGSGGQASGTMTTGSSGVRNPSHSMEDPDEILEYFEYIEEELENNPKNKRRGEWLLQESARVYDSHFSAFAPDAETIKEYAHDEDKEFRDLREDYYGKWIKSPLTEQVAIKLYSIQSKGVIA